MVSGFYEPVLALLLCLGVLGIFGIGIAYHVQCVRRKTLGFIYTSVIFAFVWAGVSVSLDTIHPLWWCLRSLQLLLDWRNLTARELEGLVIIASGVGCVISTIAFCAYHFGYGAIHTWTEETPPEEDTPPFKK